MAAAMAAATDRAPGGGAAVAIKAVGGRAERTTDRPHPAAPDFKLTGNATRLVIESKSRVFGFQN